MDSLRRARVATLLHNGLPIDGIRQNTRHRLFANTEGAEDFLEDVVVVDCADDCAEVMQDFS
jgi:hypothetical protein